jgi:hypothetical protein
LEKKNFDFGWFVVVLYTYINHLLN